MTDWLQDLLLAAIGLVVLYLFGWGLDLWEARESKRIWPPEES